MYDVNICYTDVCRSTGIHGFSLNICKYVDAVVNHHDLHVLSGNVIYYLKLRPTVPTLEIILVSLFGSAPIPILKVHHEPLLNDWKNTTFNHTYTSWWGSVSHDRPGLNLTGVVHNEIEVKVSRRIQSVCICIRPIKYLGKWRLLKIKKVR